MYPVSTICEIVKGSFLQKSKDDDIIHLVYDSRRLSQAASSLFLAIKTTHNNGHRFLLDAHKKGIRNFVVSEKVSLDELENSNVLLVNNTLDALQALAAFHRTNFSLPVIGITGSNGKTIVKEWLYQLLQDDFNIVRSPKSFNSQIGVPLSVWQMNEQHSLGIFEAGISKPGEMEKLVNIIDPTIGILTNIGEAHGEGFEDADEKIAEKIKLFKHCQTIIGREDDLTKIQNTNSKQEVLKWGKAAGNAFIIKSIEKQLYTKIILTHKSVDNQFSIPFTDDASIENAIACCCVMLALGYGESVINERISRLHAIDMRLQLKHSFNECIVINDSYSADITSLRIALEFLKQQASALKRTVILSEFFESGKDEKELYSEIVQLVKLYEINKLLVVGEKISNYVQGLLDASITLQTYASTDDLISTFRSSWFSKEIILIKGARKFEFERIAQLFEKKLHQTVLEINLNSLSHNLKEYQKLVKPGTKIMAMVKAFSYGSGGAEIASVLQYHNADYLGVAYADEGVELVKAGISLPVMVLNTEEFSFAAIVDYNLQPVIYSFGLLQKFEAYLSEQGLSSYPVHLEIETGMNRLGFAVSEVDEMAKHIAAKNVFNIQSVFTHLAASEDAGQDDFTIKQAETFQQAITIIEKYISYPFVKHISNSAAIVRHPQLQMDMVRLGIGLYGVEIDNTLDLQTVATLRSTIAQLKHVKKGESVSYNRRGVVSRDSVIATVRIGYADGYSRAFGNGAGKMLVKGQLAPVIGVVCMDMTMIDITGIADVKEGDDVIIFGPQLPVQELAGWAKTIPYEIMTSVSQRVKRIYFHE